VSTVYNAVRYIMQSSPCKDLGHSLAVINSTRPSWNSCSSFCKNSHKYTTNLLRELLLTIVMQRRITVNERGKLLLTIDELSFLKIRAITAEKADYTRQQ